MKRYSLLIAAALAVAVPQAVAQSIPSFQTGQPNPFGLSSAGANASLAAVDIDGDGDTDVMATDLIRFKFFRNLGGPNATPSFSGPLTNPFGIVTPDDYNQSVGRSGGLVPVPAFGDLDNDGDLDMIVGGNLGDFYYYRNDKNPADADPVFGTPALNPFGLTRAPNSDAAPALADLDGDGDLDLLIGNSTSYFSYLNTAAPGASQPLFGARQELPFGLTFVGATQTASLGDLDGDGDLDLVSGTNTNSASTDSPIFYFENTASANTSPTYAPPVANPFGLPDPPTSGNRIKPELTDLDTDGDLDLLVINDDGAFTFYENQPGTIGQPTALGLTVVGSNPVSRFADLDGDGVRDLLVGTGAGDLFFFKNTAATNNEVPSFAAPSSANPFGLADVGGDAAPGLGDFDGDGDLDLVVGNAEGTITYFENDPTPEGVASFTSRGVNPYGFQDLGALYKPEVEDFDNDGDLDVLTGEGSGILRVFRNITPAGGELLFEYSPATAFPFGMTRIQDRRPYTGRTAPDWVDIDFDGDLDFVSGSGDGPLILFETIGTGADGAAGSQAADPRLGPQQVDPFGINVTQGNSSPVVADFDGSGSLDILIGIESGEFLYVSDIANRPYSPAQSVALSGDAGFRMLSSPEATTVGAFLGDLFTQGYTGSDAPGGDCTVFVYDEAGDTFAEGWTCVSDASDALAAGQGVMVYVFARDLPGTLTSSTAVTPSGSFSFPGVTFTNDARTYSQKGWSLLGVPAGVSLAWDQVQRTRVRPTVYVYDPAYNGGDYRTSTVDDGAAFGDLAGGEIPPFQGFFVHALGTEPSLAAPVDAFAADARPAYARQAAPLAVRLSLSDADGERSSAWLALSETGAPGLDAVDAARLTPTAWPRATVYTTPADSDEALVVNALPRALGKAGVIEVPLGVDAAGFAGAVELALAADATPLPDGWTLTLVDRETGAETRLGDVPYRFTVASSAAGRRGAAARPEPLAAGVARFALRLSDGSVSVATGDDPAGETALGLVAPNPTRGSATVTWTLAEAGTARVSVADLLGRELAVLADGPHAAGAQRTELPDGLAPGVYVVRLRAGDTVATTRLTVVR